MLTDAELNMAYWLGYLSDREHGHMAGLNHVQAAVLERYNEEHREVGPHAV